MCREEPLGTLLEPLYGVDDVEVGRRAVGHLEDFSVATDLLQSVGESLGVAGEPYGRSVGKELALAAYGELQETGEQGREDGEDDGDEDHDDLQLSATVSSPAPSSPSSTEPQAAQEEVGDQDRGADQDTDEHGIADVEVGDVRHLVRHDALELVAVELFEEATGDGDGGVLGVAARGEGVRGGIVDDVDLRHRETRCYGHLLDHVEEYGCVIVCDLPGPRCGKDHLVAREVTDEPGGHAHYQGQGEAEEGARGVTEPGKPDYVAEDGYEGEEASYEQQAVTPVTGNALPEGTLVPLIHGPSRRRRSRTPARGPGPRSIPSR